MRRSAGKWSHKRARPPPGVAAPRESYGPEHVRRVLRFEARAPYHAPRHREKCAAVHGPGSRGCACRTCHFCRRACACSAATSERPQGAHSRRLSRPAAASWPRRAPARLLLVGRPLGALAHMHSAPHPRRPAQRMGRPHGGRHKWADEAVSECACRGALCSERGTWCGTCLWTRVGQNLDEARSDPGWRCPPCLDLCNCSGLGCTRCRCAARPLREPRGSNVRRSDSA
jgi:hypothetical protein